MMTQNENIGPPRDLDPRELALAIARTHHLPLDVVVCADEVSGGSDLRFLTAIVASADLQNLIGEKR